MLGTYTLRPRIAFESMALTLSPTLKVGPILVGDMTGVLPFSRFPEA
jgi:hypothetical protein